MAKTVLSEADKYADGYIPSSFSVIPTLFHGDLTPTGSVLNILQRAQDVGILEIDQTVIPVDFVHLWVTLEVAGAIRDALGCTERYHPSDKTRTRLLLVLTDTFNENRNENRETLQAIADAFDSHAQELYHKLLVETLNDIRQSQEHLSNESHLIEALKDIDSKLLGMPIRSVLTDAIVAWKGMRIRRGNRNRRKNGKYSKEEYDLE